MADPHELLARADAEEAAEVAALEQRASPFSALYAHWERNQWSALALDLETDRRSFDALDPAAVLGKLRDAGKRVPAHAVAERKLVSWSRARAIGAARDREEPELSEREHGGRVCRAPVEADDRQGLERLRPHSPLLPQLPGRPEHALDEARARPDVRPDCGVVEHVGAPAKEVYAFSTILVEGGCDGETETCNDELAVDRMLRARACRDVRARGLVG